MTDWSRHRRVERVLDDAPYLHLAVTTSRGVHVTPTVFEVHDRRLWLVVPRRSVKALAVARRPRVGVLAEMDGRAVLISGRAEVVDPLTARGVLSPRRLLDLPLAAAGYLGRNGRHGLAVGSDNPVPTLPLSRVALRIKVSRLALLEDGAVARSWGDWPRLGLILRGEAPTAAAPDLSGIPGRPRALLAEPGPVVLGWSTGAGPLPFPALWNPSSGLASVAPEAIVLAGAWPTGPATLTATRSGRSLNKKFGVMLAGDGRLCLTGDSVEARIDTQRMTWWTGQATGTVTATHPPTRRMA